MSLLSAPRTIAGKPVGPIGYGLMCKLTIEQRCTKVGFNKFFTLALTLFGGIPYDEAIQPMKAALNNGATFWNAVRTP
jgi:pyridoxine 4-dehydrogenase